MLDNVFHRRLEIARILLSGKTISVAQMSAFFSVGRRSIERDIEIIGEYFPVISIRGCNGGYRLVDGPGLHQDSLSCEQLKCLHEIEKMCDGWHREVVLSIIHEFCPYIDRN